MYESLPAVQSASFIKHTNRILRTVGELIIVKRMNWSRQPSHKICSTFMVSNGQAFPNFTAQ